MSAPQPLFYFGAMSPYSWFAAERIGTILPEARWRGVLAGAVFKSNGRTSWGLTDAREAGIADCDARAAEHGLGPIRWPDPWPTSDLLVARAMAWAELRGELEPYALAAMRLSFLEAVDLGELEAVLEAARRAGLDAEELRVAIGSQDVKDALRDVTDEALRAGVFGVPTVAIGEELYWGDDTLERAADAYRVFEQL
ncbi:MAG TPA: DsbA family protein [Solirubrobacteraceae bacterium]|nr:DsbA family protein [Solirubrobacteraceae bacterium]